MTRRAGVPGVRGLRRALIHLAGAALMLAAVPASSATVGVAVAANFTEAAEEIAAAFAQETGHEVRLSFGPTGALYAQITQGAPFAVLLAADDVRPARAIEEGFGVQGTSFVYAIGRLALYSASMDVSDGAAILAAGGFSHLAIADPETAPYGAAAIATLEALGHAEQIAPRLVIGQSIAQALQFVKSGNAEIGMVAASQVLDEPSAHVWPVPQDLHAPIRQDAVLLRSAEDDEAARSFLAFLRSERARKIIESYGYDVPD